MVIRKQKEIEKFIKTIDREWSLSIIEYDVLEYLLNIFLAGENNEIKKIFHLLNDETEELLKLLDSYNITRFVERHFDMVAGDDCKDLEDYDDDDLLSECSRGDFNFEIDDIQEYDLVDDNLLCDIKEVFNNLNVFDRKRLRDKIINFK